MGHINLAAPIVHIWFFKAMPSRLGTLLEMKTTDLEKVIYFQDYVVTDPGDTPLKPKQLLTEDEYREARGVRGRLQADMGADAVREAADGLDLPNCPRSCARSLTKTRSKQKIKEIIKRLKLVESIRDSENARSGWCWT
jgi:DNA-directed RNA polymerase subunit beta'